MIDRSDIVAWVVFTTATTIILVIGIVAGLDGVWYIAVIAIPGGIGLNMFITLELLAPHAKECLRERRMRERISISRNDPWQPEPSVK